VTLFFIAALALIIPLAIYAFVLMRKLSQQTQQQNDRRQKRVDNYLSSIRTIALAVSQQQCDLSEACIRLAVLLESIPLANRPDYVAMYPAIHQLYDGIKHMATHEARQGQDVSQTREDDQIRADLEAELSVKIIREAQALYELNINH
jgi:ABC-type multidrug transport system fused ATPase/permease subunit